MLNTLSDNSVVKMVRSFFSFENEDNEMERFGRPQPARGKVVPISDRLNTAAINIKNPRTRDDAIDTADRLKEGSVCIVNLSKLEKEIAKEILYFLSGSIHALGGDSKKIGTDIFLFTPQNVDITQLEDVPEKKFGQNSLGFDDI